jgi:hypothetical protein
MVALARAAKKAGKLAYRGGGHKDAATGAMRSMQRRSRRERRRLADVGWVVGRMASDGSLQIMSDLNLSYPHLRHVACEFSLAIPGNMV